MIGFSDDKKKNILKEWQELLLAEYPVKPVVEIINYLEECAESLLSFVEAYYKGKETDVEEAVDDLMRFLATDRKLTPGESIAQILYLKKLLLKEFPDIKKEDFVKLNDAVDILACKAFNRYMEAREHIYELRLKEKQGMIDILKRAMDMYEKYYGLSK